MVKVKFNPRPGVPCFEGPGGHWNPEEVKSVPDDMAERLIGLHQSPFTKVEDKAFHAPEDKMMRGTEENKVGRVYLDENDKIITDRAKIKEFEQLFTGKEPDKQGPAIAEEAANIQSEIADVTGVPAEAVGQDGVTAEPEPKQQPGESNTKYKARLKAWREKGK
jgi:hypothetical protein